MHTQKIAARRKLMLIKNTENYGYFFIAPYLLLLVVFSLAPTLFTLWISFTKWNYFNDMTWVGLDNYIQVLKGKMFYKSLLNTLRIILLALPACIITALGIAYMLEVQFKKFAKTFKAISFLPYVTTPVAVGVLFGLLFDYQTGFINIFLQKLGLAKEPIYWMANPNYVVLIVALIVFWKNLGYFMLLYFAGLKSVPTEMYEAADIDGANTWHKFRYVALPIIKPITVFIVITSIIWGLQIFDEPSLLVVGTDNNLSIASTLGGPEKSVYTLVSYVYEEGFILFRTGTASAVAYLMTIVIIVLSWVGFKALNREGTGR
ncbi:carbohydrate ABC transporter permease [Paenibacillus sedimenti]|uniref:Sugar ABC transporter permease n=1 Tax=Paenibacillus sedimenti TaxID=2770274 RepID=A0A926QHH9_9BACL|nr:sugar ABC transporter permease [Paenibacillus sedimenti]MBD0378538.1 sugar ABC transporter permease [Paenibacillus sedimenti]